MTAVRRRRYNPTWEELESLPADQRLTAYRDQTYALQWTDADPYFPGQMWHTPSAVTVVNGARFQDPQQFTYYKYVTERAESSLTLDTCLSMAEDLSGDATPEWVAAWDEVFSPFKFAQGGLATQTSAMSSYVKDSYENFFLVFESFDDLNFVYRSVELARAVRTGPPIVDPRTYWREAKYFQPLRELLEKTATFSDVYEVALAHHFFTRPLLKTTYYEILREWSRIHRDFLSARVFTALKKDMDWHDAAGMQLLLARVEDDRDNLKVLRDWAVTWGPAVLEALRPLIVHLGERLGNTAGADQLMEAGRTLVTTNTEALDRAAENSLEGAGQ